MPFPRLPLLAQKAGAHVPLLAYLSAAALATVGVGLIYLPAGLIVLALFCLAVAVLP